MNHHAKLTWQCRRGTQELDALLLGYLQTVYPYACLTEQQQFEQLLTLSDLHLLQLFFFKPSVNYEEFSSLIEKITRITTI